MCVMQCVHDIVNLITLLLDLQIEKNIMILMKAKQLKGTNIFLNEHLTTKTVTSSA